MARFSFQIGGVLFILWLFFCLGCGFGMLYAVVHFLLKYW